MSIEIESRKPGILAHVLKRELNELLARNPYLRKSIRVLITSHDKLFILIDETLDTASAVDKILHIVDRLLKDFTVRKIPKR
jgi:hypothetical protein